MKLFDFEEERVKQEIARLGAKRVLIQLPEGLKNDAPRLARIIEKSGALAIVSIDPCYGACDLAMSDAEALNADLMVHYGHSKMVKYERVPTIYIEARASADINDAIGKALPLLENYRRIGIATTVQHVQTVDEAREILVRSGKTVVVGDTRQLSYAGQVVGCNYSNAKSIAKEVEAFLFIGGGKFHAVGVALSTSKPTIVADPYDNSAYSVNNEAEKIVKQRWASIETAEKAKTFAVLVGLKPGQKRLEEALDIKQSLEKNRRTAFLFAAKEVTPEALLEFPSVDAYVNTACPRLSLDDAVRFNRPILTVREALVVVGELSWEELCKEGLLES